MTITLHHLHEIFNDGLNGARTSLLSVFPNMSYDVIETICDEISNHVFNDINIESITFHKYETLINRLYT